MIIKIFTETENLNQMISIQWYNPRNGGELIVGTPGTVNGDSENVSLGTPPNTPGQDWVVLLKAVK